MDLGPSDLSTAFGKWFISHFSHVLMIAYAEQIKRNEDQILISMYRRIYPNCVQIVPQTKHPTSIYAINLNRI